MNFVRSSPCLTCSNGARTQVNQLTAYIDASNIYGSLANQANQLRTLDGTGRLRISGNGLLPQSANPRTDQCSRPEQNRMCFGSGDSRVNLTPGLTSLHTIFHRQHNRLAASLRQLNPQWDEERLFQETRRLLGAQMQMIVYDEFLPVVLGRTRMAQFDLSIRSGGSFTAYNPSIDASIYTEFSSAAYRFGHSLISPQFHRTARDGRRFGYTLKNNYFNPHVLRQGDLDTIVRGALIWLCWNVKVLDINSDLN
jgi:peroxidase